VGISRHSEFPNKKQSVPGLKLRGKGQSVPSEQKSYQFPRPPGKPRKVFKDLGKRVKTAVQGDI